MSWWDSMSEGVSSWFSSGDGWDSIFDGILGGLSGVSKGKSDKESTKIAGEYSLRQVREGGMESRRNTEYQTRMAKWLKDKEKEDRRKGLSNYAKFSRNDYGPMAYTPPEVGDMPTASAFDAPAYDDRGNRIPLSQLARQGGP